MSSLVGWRLAIGGARRQIGCDARHTMYSLRAEFHQAGSDGGKILLNAGHQRRPRTGMRREIPLDLWARRVVPVAIERTRHPDSHSRRRRLLGIGEHIIDMAPTRFHLDPASGVRAEFVDTAGRTARRALSDCISGKRCRLACPFDRIVARSTSYRNMEFQRPAGHPCPAVSLLPISGPLGVRQVRVG